MNEKSIRIPITFWVIAIAALAWNIIGIINFFSQVLMSEESLAKLPENQQGLFESTPDWIYIIFGIAVFSGALASIALLMRKRWSIPVFLISLLAVVIQMSYNLIISDAPEVYGSLFFLFPSFVILVSAFLYYYAIRAGKARWIT